MYKYMSIKCIAFYNLWTFLHIYSLAKMETHCCTKFPPKKVSGSRNLRAKYFHTTSIPFFLSAGAAGGWCKCGSTHYCSHQKSPFKILETIKVEVLHSINKFLVS